MVITMIVVIAVKHVNNYDDSQGPYGLMMQPSILTIMMMISQGPYRHYVLNLLWILINVLCLALTIYHLNKLYRCNIGDVGNVDDGGGYHLQAKGKRTLFISEVVIHPTFLEAPVYQPYIA